MSRVTLSKGVFIVLCGPDGSGKSTQAGFLCRWLSRKGYDVVSTREPGGDPVCADIKKILTQSAHDAHYDPPIVDGMVEFFLFCADRRQHVKTVIEPALADKKVVVCDRYVPDTYAYQCHARNALNRHEFKYIMDRAVSNVPAPDVTLWLDLDPSIGLERKYLTQKLDRFEAEELSFHEAVAKGFKEFFTLSPEYNPVRINAAESKRKMFVHIRSVVEPIVSRCVANYPAT